MRKVVTNFITENEKVEIIDFVNRLDMQQNIDNIHIKEVAKELNGKSYMFDITKTNISKELSQFQSSQNVFDISLPSIFNKLLERISKYLNISKENIFLQILDMNKGGLIHPHYDSSIDGYINFKCNISVLSEDYILNVDKNKLSICEGDLYTFEASLYKHWTLPFSSRRVLLSYGFIIPYVELGWEESDPRIRMSQRIQRYFQNS